MGGIVVRELILTHRDKIKSSKIGVVLVASPSTGSSLANLLSPATWFYNYKQASNLKRGDTYLESLNKRFESLLKSQPANVRIVGKALAETVAIPLLLPIFITRFLPFRSWWSVVTPDAAMRFFEGQRVGGVDHYSIATPKNTHHLTYTSVYNFLLSEGFVRKTKHSNVANPNRSNAQ